MTAKSGEYVRLTAKDRTTKGVVLIQERVIDPRSACCGKSRLELRRRQRGVMRSQGQVLEGRVWQASFSGELKRNYRGVNIEQRTGYESERRVVMTVCWVLAVASGGGRETQNRQQ